MSDFGPMTAEEVQAVASIVALSFTGTRDESAEWLAKAGHEHVRVLRDEGAPSASLLRIAMGQWFGGRSVPMVGVAAVGVAPERRGRGTAGRLMEAALREMHGDGVPLSGLYAATQPLYRRAGYEQAGHRFEVRLPMRSLDLPERQMRMREITPEDEEEVAACYRSFAAAFDGPLDRGAYIWGRVRKSRGQESTGFATIGESGAIEGYIYLRLARKADRGRQEVHLSDLAFTTPQAGRRLLSFLADFGSMADEAIFFGGPMHPALFLLSEQRFSIDLGDHWMLRIVTVPAALEARGYAATLRSSICLDVRDESIAGNQGPWVLNVENGRGRVERASGPLVLSLGVASLAALYSGYLSATQLRLLGRLEASDDAVRACDGVFAGTTPWMSDMY